MRSLRGIDINRIVAYLGNNDSSEFEERRNQKEYDLMAERVEEIRQTPVYRWPERKRVVNCDN